MTLRRCLLPIIAGAPICGAGVLLLLRYAHDTVLLLVGVFLVIVGLALLAGGIFTNLANKHNPLR